MTFSRGWDVADTVELRPFVDRRIVTPNVVEPLETIRTTEARILSVAVQHYLLSILTDTFCR
jgi:hypothetical protein